MSSIEKMLIKGIRSFSPNNTNVIEFYKPLTLIVGQNGAGKTTVIECLKMACTGDLPPNTRSGQTFIHDPKVSGDTEVKAQIKLRCRSTNGRHVVIVRSFQLTQKATKMEYKALESVIQTMNESTGEREAISHRCADMDRLVPTMMGVSKAILENVIFVHQEDASWPLQEGAVLKKKFDDIFSATRYTKALEAIRKLRLEQAAGVREMKLKLQNIKQFMDTAHRTRKNMEEDTGKSHTIRQQMSQLEEEITALRQEQSTLERKLSSLGDHREGQRVLVARQEMAIRQSKALHQKVLESDLDEDTVNETVEQLEAAFRTFSEVLNKIRGQKGQSERLLQAKRVETEAVREQHQRDVAQHGRATAEAEAHAKRLAQRDETARAMAQRTGLAQLPGSGSEPLPAGSARELLVRGEEKLAQLGSATTALKARHRELDERKAEELEAVARQVTEAEQALTLGEQQRRKNEARARELQVDLEGCMASESALETAAAAEADAKKAHEDKRAELHSAGLDAQADEVEGELETVGRGQAKVRREREQAAAAQERVSALKYKREELSRKKQELAQLMATKSSALQSALGAVPEPASVRAQCERLVAQRQEALRGARREAEEARGKAATAEGALKAARATEATLRGEIESARVSIREGLLFAAPDSAESENAFPNACQSVEDEEKSSRKNLGELEGFSKVLNSVTTNSVAKGQCTMCDRPFRDEGEVQQFEGRMAQKRESLPARFADVQEQLREAEARLTRVNQLRPVWQRYDDLRSSELPKAADAVHALEGELEAAEAASRDAGEAAAVSDAEHASARALAQELGVRVDSLIKEISALEVNTDTMESSLADVGGGSDLQSLEDVEREATRLEEERERLERRRADVQRRRERLAAEVAAAHGAWRDAREAHGRVQGQVQRERELRRQLEELESANRAIAEKRKENEERAAPLQRERERVAAERTRDRQQWQQREADADADRTRLQREIDALRLASGPIDTYDARGGADDLARAEAALQRGEVRMKELEGAVAKLEEEVRNADKQLVSRDKLKRDIEDALAYKRAVQQQEELAAKIEEAAAKTAHIGDPDDVQANLDRVTTLLEETLEKKNMCRGTLGAFNQSIDKSKKELALAQYKDIDKRYGKQLIEMRTTEMASKDLDKYHQALDKALMNFHTTKMAEINKIVKELWQKTYRNQDIDYIQIRSEGEGAGGSTASRSYNYRVVMRSGSAELDMRGRCSAGQRVLACLIIRLALAETFCLNCGILALDEPTTNLDGPNSASLAEALTALMHSRKDQTNFQLVVITHDEQFAQMIGHREHAEYYYRITKDEDQHSKIEREAIFE